MWQHGDRQRWSILLTVGLPSRSESAGRFFWIHIFASHLHPKWCAQGPRLLWRKTSEGEAEFCQFNLTLLELTCREGVATLLIRNRKRRNAILVRATQGAQERPVSSGRTFPGRTLCAFPRIARHNRNGNPEDGKASVAGSPEESDLKFRRGLRMAAMSKNNCCNKQACITVSQIRAGYVPHDP